MEWIDREPAITALDATAIDDVGRRLHQAARNTESRRFTNLHLAKPAVRPSIAHFINMHGWAHESVAQSLSAATGQLNLFASQVKHSADGLTAYDADTRIMLSRLADIRVRAS